MSLILYLSQNIRNFASRSVFSIGSWQSRRSSYSNFSNALIVLYDFPTIFSKLWWYSSASCGATEFRCSQSSRCIPAHKVCDKKFDCWDGSDEVQCMYTAQRRNCRNKVSGELQCGKLSHQKYLDAILKTFRKYCCFRGQKVKLKAKDLTWL